MKVFLIYVGDILHCPPAMNVIQTLSDLKIPVVVCTNRFDMKRTSNTFTLRKNITIGKNVFFNVNCCFQDRGGIIIGDGVFIGQNVIISTLNHGFQIRRILDNNR